MAGWHHWCNGRELGQTSGDGEGQGGLVSTSMGSQRIGYDSATEQQQQFYFTWIVINICVISYDSRRLFEMRLLKFTCFIIHLLNSFALIQNAIIYFYQVYYMLFSLFCQPIIK